VSCPHVLDREVFNEFLGTMPLSGIAGTTERIFGKAAKGALNNGAGNAANGPRLNNQLLAGEVASGHGFQKHVVENREFDNLGITTQ
jgi:hypothetical protein